MRELTNKLNYTYMVYTSNEVVLYAYCAGPIWVYGDSWGADHEEY